MKHRILILFSFLLSLTCSGGWEVPSPGDRSIFNAPTTEKQPVQLLIKLGSNEMPAYGIKACLIPVIYRASSKYDISASGLSTHCLNADSMYILFTGIDSGFYNLEVSNLVGRKGFVQSIKIDNDSTREILCTLKTTGAILGSLVDSLNYPLPESTFVYVSGTGYYSYTNMLGSFFIDSLPKGNHKLGLVKPPANSKDTTVIPVMTIPDISGFFQMHSDTGTVNINSSDTVKIKWKVNP